MGEVPTLCVKLKEAQKHSPKKYFLILYFMIVLDSQKIQGRTENLHIPHLKLSYIAFVILQ